MLKETIIQRRDRSLCPTIDCGPGKTEQHHKDKCDINLILKDYAKTGFLKHARENAGRYDDVTSVDFQRSMEIIANTKSLFEGLPAQVRKEFGHNPAAFLDYVQTPENVQELAKRGILVGNDGLSFTGDVTTAPTQSSLRGGDQPPTAGEPTSDSASAEASGEAS